MGKYQTLKILISIFFVCSIFAPEGYAATEKNDFSYTSQNSRTTKKGSIKNKITKKIKASQKNRALSTSVPSATATFVSEFAMPPEEELSIPPEVPQTPETTSVSIDNTEPENTEPAPEEIIPLVKPQNPKLSKFINPFDNERYNAAIIIDNNCQEKYGCNPYLMMSVLKRESNIQIWRVNKSGAAGIAQFLPETARGYGLFVPEYENEQCQKNNSPDETGLFTKNTVAAVNCDTTRDERFHLEKSIKAMIQKVLNLIHQNEGNDRMALANYNGGWWPSFFKESFSKDTNTCVNEITAQTAEIAPDTFLIVTQGAQTIHGGMNPFTAPNDKIVTRSNIEQVCSYVNSVSAYKESFMVGQWP